MAETRRYAAANRLDIEQILLEARHRWLRPPEICEILQNYKKFQLSTEPPTTPPSGSLFLFDRKALRYFRKDGHNWRKKKDGKTVKEAHERLKAGSIDVLHCYYAHGEGNENFQRRSYWLLEEELSHIVFVHYLEVKGSRASFNRIQSTEETTRRSQETGEIFSNEIDGYASCSINQNGQSMHSQATDSTSVNGVQASENEDAESAYNHQASSKFQSHHEIQQPARENTPSGFDPYYEINFSAVRDNNQNGLQTIPVADSSIKRVDEYQVINGAGSNGSRKSFDSQTWEEILGSCDPGVEGLPSLYTLTQPNNITSGMSRREPEVLDKMLYSCYFAGQQFDSTQEAMKFQHQLDQKFSLDGISEHSLRFHDQGPAQTATENLAANGKASYACVMRQHLLDSSLGKGGLEKMDSFDRWMNKELGDVNDIADANESFIRSNPVSYWGDVENENEINDPNSQRKMDGYILSPSLSQEQLFSINDFTPSWTYVGCEMKVLVTGRFLKTREETETCKWSCMFGELEVPAEVIADGVLRCISPVHEAGRVPFYITCSNRLACSEVREFEFRVGLSHSPDKATEKSTFDPIEDLRKRFVKLLCSTCAWPSSVARSDSDLSQLSSKISSLLLENTDELDQMLTVSSAGSEFSPEKMKNQLIEKFLKERLHSWLLQKVAEGGKGPSVLDDGGLGVLHFSAALDYDWALEPTIVAGVSVNFRDANGWTALHWAAFSGRERMVGSLIALGAAPGAVTDPTPNYPSGRTPSDLAYANGHKGIAGYLAESALTAHVSSLNLNEQSGNGAETSAMKAAVEAVPGQSNSSLTDSLAAVCKATQAAARIHQVFRMQSFQRKQIKEFEDVKFGMSDERALSLVAVKTQKTRGHNDDSAHAAATRIQNKFRSYKGRKDYLITRQRIIRIQAHVRGYQVRKNYRKIIWSVGILDKIILRWRRKGSGLRGFKSEAVTDGMEDVSKNEEDDDFFKEGRKQTEQRLQKALARVKSMVQYPEARDQYRRLLNVVNEIQESKVEKAIAMSEETTYLDDDLIDIDALLEYDDIPMPMES